MATTVQTGIKSQQIEPLRSAEPEPVTDTQPAGTHLPRDRGNRLARSGQQYHSCPPVLAGFSTLMPRNLCERFPLPPRQANRRHLFSSPSPRCIRTLGLLH